MKTLKLLFVSLALCVIVGLQASAQSFVVYDNGPIITHPGEGPDGSDASMLDGAAGLSTLGFGSAWPDIALADDFTIPEGQSWLVDGFNFFAYQTSATELTLNGVYAAIYDRSPAEEGAQVVWGDRNVNLFDSVSWTNIYRVSDTTMTSTARRIQLVTARFEPVLLTSGTYWLAWSLTGTISSGPWVPPVTYPGEDFAGNAVQLFQGSWAAAQDTGTLTQKAVPFQVTSPVPEPALMAQVLFGGGLGMLAFLRRKRR